MYKGKTILFILFKIMRIILGISFFLMSLITILIIKNYILGITILTLSYFIGFYKINSKTNKNINNNKFTTIMILSFINYAIFFPILVYIFKTKNNAFFLSFDLKILMMIILVLYNFYSLTIITVNLFNKKSKLLPLYIHLFHLSFTFLLLQYFSLIIAVIIPIISIFIGFILYTFFIFFKDILIFNLALNFVNNQKINEAEKILIKSLEKTSFKKNSPAINNCYFLLAGIKFNKGDFNLCEEYLEKIIGKTFLNKDIDLLNSNISYLLTVSKFLLNKYDEVLNNTKNISVENQKINIEIITAVLELKNGNNDNAKKIFDKNYKLFENKINKDEENKEKVEHLIEYVFFIGLYYYYNNDKENALETLKFSIINPNVFYYKYASDLINTLEIKI